MDYGARASADLIVTRGKGFTKEKNKKKRGSYRGGVSKIPLLSARLSRDSSSTVTRTEPRLASDQ